MAKRPPSNPPAEEDVVKAPEASAVEPADDVAATVFVEPVAMEEPPRFEPDPSAPSPVEPQFVHTARVEPEPVATDATVPREADPIVAPPPPPVSQPAAKTGGSGFLGTALGGVVAAAAGYALAIFVPFPGIGTSDAPPPVTQDEVKALAARVEAVESAPAPDATLADRIAALEALPVPDIAPEQDLSLLSDALTALEARVAGIESRGSDAPVDAPSADLVALVESLRAEVAEMQASGADANAGIEALAVQTEARLAEAEAQAAALRVEAEKASRRALTAAALGRVQAALESGAPFAGALADIPDVEIPAALASLAETGVPSRAALEDAFPPAARAALDASLRADMGDAWSDRLASFLQATTGARSLTPREGTDPDAVLSRAEAAVRVGDLSQALAEVQGLPPEGLAEMSDWTNLARQRLDAVTAAAALSAAVEG
ncbi:MAG: COG4223 family protein [Paracoccaceae bacterium]